MLRAAGRTVARAGGTALTAGRAAGSAWSARKDRKASGGAAPGSAREQRRAARREARDARRAQKVAAKRTAVEGRARVRSRKAALRRSAARHQLARAGAALAAAPLGLLSMLLWPIAKLLRIPAPRWGRRLFRHLTAAAKTARAYRDVAAHKEHQEAEAVAAGADRGSVEDVDAPANTTPQTFTTTVSEDTMTNPNSFDFRAAAEEMLKQAQTAEPGGMMSVLASFESLPETLGLIAETFAVVAGRCSEEMPLDPAVGEALNDVNRVLLSATEGAGEVSRVFAERHEADIRRHVDPRPGEQAWDTSANQE
ncbi:hypothetical protein AB0N09_42640 [Streptomyces erythrochromogenes]|uniref:hypothetical protein n=1 Tax=Streptomyces erythrochromogenes TaxID=285574 RepID=UPI00342CABF4